jgi:tripartite-type tricarboxylate transporter receptor subunit TctC
MNFDDKRQWMQASMAVFGAAFLPAFSHAQSWPVKPVRLVVAFPPGGLIDNMARLVAPKLALELGQPVVIDNKPGAGGNLGAAEVARAAPDGYTLLMASPPLTISPALYKALPYKPEQITPVAMLGRVPNVLVVKAGGDVTTLRQLTDKARAAPGRLNYASNGNGTSLHLSAELYKSLGGAFITHIPYRGAAAAITAVLAGEVDMMFDNLPSALGQIQAGALRALAVTTPQRSKVLPDVPTMAEAGVAPFDVSAWFGLALPTGTPAPVQSRLVAAMQKISSLPDISAAMLRLGAEPAFMDSKAMAAFMAEDAAKWLRVAKFANISLDT